MSVPSALPVPFAASRAADSPFVTARGLRAGDALTFLVPTLLVGELSFGGTLFVSEVVLLAALPLLLDQARRQGVQRVSKTFVVLGFVWLFGQVETDIYRGAAFADYSRGWSKIVFLILNFAALSFLIDGRWRRVMLFAAGLALGEVLQFYLSPNTLAAGNPWKFGLGPPLTLAGVLLASRPAVFRRPPVSAAILFALSLVNLRQDFRSLAGVCFVAGIYVFLAGRKASRQRAMSLKAVVLLLAASAVGGLVFLGVYSHAASSGALGSTAQQKYLRQQGSLGVLIGGRPQILVSLRAIRDEPLLGHGSWAKDPKYGLELQQVLQRAGYATSQPAANGLIPSHSHLFGAWVDAGILGAVFWVWVLALIGSALLRLPRIATSQVPLVAFITLSFAWDVFFSPFGAERRLVVPFYVLVLLLVRAESREGRAAV